MVNLKALAGSHPGCAAASPSSPQEMSCYWMTVSSTSPQCPPPYPPPSATLLIKKPASLCDPFGSHVPSLGRVQGKWTLHSDVAFECNYSILSVPWFGVTPPSCSPRTPGPPGFICLHRCSLPPAPSGPWSFNLASFYQKLSPPALLDMTVWSMLITLACDLDTLEDSAVENYPKL